MSIHRLLEKSAFGQDDIERLTKAFEQALRTIGVKDPLSELIAKKVFEAGQTGLKDPKQICAHAVAEIRHSVTGL